MSVRRGESVVKVAIVHDWLTGMRGGERVLDALVELWPEAEIFTLLHVPGTVSRRIEALPIHTSFVQRIPFARRGYRRLLPLFPRAVESLDLSGFDLVISSSHCVAKGARVPAGVPHVCYSHTPMRYVWDQQEAYVAPGRAGLALRMAMSAFAPRLRAWDVKTAAGVDRFIANSTHVRERIRRYYGREASVVHPPVELSRFHPLAAKEDFYLFLGAPAPYKRMDLALAAFARLDRRLVVAGEGVLGRREVERAIAVGMRNVTFMDRLDDEGVAAILRRARALLMPGVEDFGITAVEALASGTPVIALGQGGVLDTVRPVGRPCADGPTGLFFHEATPGSLADAVLEFEEHRFDVDVLAASARRFARARFLDAMRDEIDAVLGGRSRPERVA
jgi:glycosyltransferase involved in cell wall biosynthesis